jgi:ABC-2 type transport system permease protein
VIATYRTLLVGQFQQASQYRVSMFLYLLFSLIRPIIFLAAWDAVAQARGGSVGGFTAADFAGYYVCMALVLHFTTAWNAYEFEFEVAQGRLSPKLLRPLHPLHYSVVENLTWKAFTAFGLFPALAVVAITFHARFETQWWNVALFVPSLLLGAALRFFLGWVVAAAAFWTTRVNAVVTLFDRTAFIFAGQIAPLALMPGILQTISYILPFGYWIGIPTDILRGGVSVEQSLVWMAGQVAWLIASYVLLQIVWRAGVRQYSAAGA